MSRDIAQEESVRETVQTFFQLLGTGDADRVADVFAEEIDWYVPGDESLPWVGRRTRREQVPGYFNLLWPALVAGESVVEFHKLLVDGADAVWLGRFTHTVQANKRTFTTPVAFHFTIENGKIVRLHLYEDTHAVSQAVAA
ncbi:nuclear transport factor 2 family protein [Micromonospora sp. GCM10011542]|uniref:nuclear transport factor 2 family protein n=1 Tax=Micromonospora sp. GCM10011542 TaxID=3317337 RepID=UPI003622FC38